MRLVDSAAERGARLSQADTAQNRCQSEYKKTYIPNGEPVEKPVP